MRSAYLPLEARFAEAIIIFGNKRFAVLVALRCKCGQDLAFAIFKPRALELLLRFLHYTLYSVVFHKCLLPQKTSTAANKHNKSQVFFVRRNAARFYLTTLMELLRIEFRIFLYT